MATWKIAGVQFDCVFANRAANLDRIQSRLREADHHGARLIVFPECALTGYCFESFDEARPHAETIPGPTTEKLSETCRQLHCWAVVGLLEAEPVTNRVFNSCALIGPAGVSAVYRKIHLPYLGVDRFVTPGDRPFAVQDIGGLRIGMNICYDGSFPESARVLTLLGADLIVLATNWPTKAERSACLLVPARALENHVYYAAVNRVGSERGFRFIGHSQIVDVTGDRLCEASDSEETILYATIDPGRARSKKIVNIPGQYEVNRLADRRPEMYGPLSQR